MHSISPERWRIISPHLDRALDVPQEERAAWLAALRADDPDLAADLEALLEELATLDREGFLTGESAIDPGRKTLAGLEVGAYVLKAPLGQGGMGQVWLAERSDGRFEGRAAVKLLNLSLMGREGEARFRQEGRLLARLRHPCIAHLIDAGMLHTGQPYLILEHVDGEPIDRYCDTKRLGIDERIQLFLQVLSAVAFAHANLVVHRDLKPPNILVGAGGEVKLLDFGIAKLLDSDGSRGADTTLTHDGVSALTPRYAAPEQLSGGTLTTATDIYALGVVLYLLLTGQHPAGPDATSPADLIKSVMERQASRPSDVVADQGLLPEPALADNAARRAGNPKRLRRLLQGDLDNIVAKALNKDPAGRYPSAGALADDLRRYLNDEPVSARPDAMAYRAVKFIRRNRGGVAAAGLLAAAVLAGSGGVAWQAREARIQRDAAEAQLARATATNDFTSYLLSVGAPSGKKFTVGELLDQAEQLIDKMFAHDDTLRAEMLVVVGQEFMASERWERATPILERAQKIVERSTDPGLRARAQCPLAFLRIMNGQRDEAAAMIDRALADLPVAPQHDFQRAECLLWRGAFGYFDGDGRAMIRSTEQARAILDRSKTAASSKKIDALSSLAYGYYLDRQNEKAGQTYAQVMEALAQVGRDNTLAAADALNNWALVYYQGDIAKAEPLCRRSVELRRSIEGSGSVMPTITFNLAGVLMRLGKYDEAERLYEETIRTAGARQESRAALDAMMELAELHIERGDPPSAAAQLDKLAPYAGTPEFDRHRQAQMAYYQGRLAQARGDHASARQHYGRSIEIFDRGKAKIAMNVSALIGHARSAGALGDSASASASAARALALAESFVEQGSFSYLVGLSLAAQGDILAAQGKIGEAREAFGSAHRHLERTLGAGHPAARSALARAS